VDHFGIIDNQAYANQLFTPRTEIIITGKFESRILRLPCPKKLGIKIKIYPFQNAIIIVLRLEKEIIN